MNPTYPIYLSQILYEQKATNCLSVFDQFVRLALKGLYVNDFSFPYFWPLLRDSLVTEIYCYLFSFLKSIHF